MYLLVIYRVRFALYQSLPQMLGIGTAASLVASFSGAQKAALASAEVNPAQLVQKHNK